MKYLSILVLVMVPVSASAQDFDLTKLGKAKPIQAQAEPAVAQTTKPAVKAAEPVVKLDCSTGTCRVVVTEGVGDGNNAVVTKTTATTVQTPTRYWGVVGYQRVGLFGRRPVYGWISTSGTVVRSSTVRSTSSCSTGRCRSGG